MARITTNGRSLLSTNTSATTLRQQQQQQQQQWTSFRVFSIGFFVGLIGFAIVTFYISDMSIQHTTGTSSSSNNYYNIHNSNDISGTANSKKQNTNNGKNTNELAGLSCTAYGGPAKELAEEMVYWQDIPSDSQYISPMKTADGTEQYLTFEPDNGGWNNIRMAMETVLAMAAAMGRTLVLPPESGMYLLGKKNHETLGHTQQNTFSFNHFFPMEQIHHEFHGLNIIPMHDYLQKVAMTGHMIHKDTKKVSFPPNNRTQWDGRNDITLLYTWLRSVSYMKIFVPEECLFVFPTSHDPANIDELRHIETTIITAPTKPQFEHYINHPVPIDGTVLERLQENWANRKKLCIYDLEMQAATQLHFPVDHQLDARLLVHFYAFVFFQNYKQDLWMKRFIRDHVRYTDEIQCAAARVVAAVRNHARKTDPINNPNGIYDAFHIRRGDFQYQATRVDAPEILIMAQKKIPKGSTVFIATDERQKSFFQPLRDHYDVVFLDDFLDEALLGINTNFYGMIDQLVTTRSRTFYGCWFSTFTGYINRLRGYHADKEKRPGYEMGLINSWYYVLKDRFDHMQQYYPVKQSFYAREFPTSWRLIDTTLETS